jgi:hypothetical protein
MKKVHTIEKQPGQDAPDFMFWCPACQCGHAVWTEDRGGKPMWKFNGNFDAPTFSPSLLIHHGSGGKEICHTVVSDGVINYCSDCTHAFAGRSIPMEEF